MSYSQCYGYQGHGKDGRRILYRHDSLSGVLMQYRIMSFWLTRNLDRSAYIGNTKGFSLGQPRELLQYGLGQVLLTWGASYEPWSELFSKRFHWAIKGLLGIVSGV